jgi:outer membrane protein OmpA-like peptidoglycan-associated protein
VVINTPIQHPHNQTRRSPDISSAAMKSLLLLLALTASLSAQEATRSLTPDAALKALSRSVERTQPTAKAQDLGVDRAFAVPTETSRDYGRERDFVIVKKSDGSEAKLPLLDLPVHFQKNTTVLADATSEANLRTLAQTIRGLADKENARFDIEGHASPEGDAQRNDALSKERASAIVQRLELLVPEGTLKAKGYGAEHAKSKAYSPEPELAKDRQIKVVRVK